MICDGYVLVIAEPDDAEAGLVHRALLERSVDVIRFDTADFPEHLELVATPGAAHPGWLHT